MNNWDMLLLMPIILFLTIGVLVFIVFKEKIRGKTLLYLIEISLFWLLLGFMFYATLGYSFQIFEKEELVKKNSAFLTGTLFIGLIYMVGKPLAVFLTTIIKSRKVWIIGSYLLALVWFIIYMALGLNVVTTILLWTTLLLVASASTVQILAINEQYFYKINTFPLVWTLLSFCSYFILTAYFAFQVHTLYFLKQRFLVPILMVIILLVILVLACWRKENRANTGAFEDVIIEQLPKIKTKTLLALYGLAFVVTLGWILANTTYTKLLIFTNLEANGFSKATIQLLYRVSSIWFLIPIVWFSYSLNKFILNLIGQKNLIFIAMFLLFTTYGTMAFVKNGIALIIFNLIANFMFAQVFFSLFSFAFFWTYRTKANPVLGIFWTVSFFAIFLVKLVEGFLQIKEIGVLKDVELNGGYIITTMNLNLLQTKLENIATITFASAAAVILGAVLLFNFTAREVLADFKNYKLAIQNIKVLVKNRIKEKTKTQINLKGKTDD